MAEILTVTLNPTVDKSCSVSKVMPEHKLRCSAPQHDPGGGGINVARVIHKLGADATAIWMRGGHVGQLLDGLLDEEGVPHEPQEIEGLTREHLIVYEEASEQQYRFGMPGPKLTPDELNQAHTGGCRSTTLPTGLPGAERIASGGRWRRHLREAGQADA
jgi:6-phosphofructokinase 2